jgi:hypothetical protein
MGSVTVLQKETEVPTENLQDRQPSHRVETYIDVTDRCKHCGRLRYHVPTFFQATGRKMINCACSASLKWVVIRSSSNQMHASSNLPSMRTKKVGTLVTSLYVSTLWPSSSLYRFRLTILGWYFNKVCRYVEGVSWGSSQARRPGTRLQSRAKLDALFWYRTEVKL